MNLLFLCNISISYPCPLLIPCTLCPHTLTLLVSLAPLIPLYIMPFIPLYFMPFMPLALGTTYPQTLISLVLIPFVHLPPHTHGTSHIPPTPSHLAHFTIPYPLQIILINLLCSLTSHIPYTSYPGMTIFCPLTPFQTLNSIRSLYCKLDLTVIDLNAPLHYVPIFLHPKSINEFNQNEQSHKKCSFYVTETDHISLLGALMISSGLVLHICVGALFVMDPSQNQQSKVMECEIKKGKEDSEHAIDGNAEAKSVGTANLILGDTKTENSAAQMTFALFSNPSFIFLLCNCFAFQFGNAVVYTHIVAFAASEGVHQSMANVLVSALGLSSLFSRVILSALSQHPRINTVILYTTVIVICGNTSYCQFKTKL